MIGALNLPTRPFYATSSGATLGGPIKQDKAFFFFSYSGLRQITSSFLSGARVPTALERAGNFTASATKPTDPATNAPFVCNGVTNVICPNRIDAVARKIIDTYIPLSNVTLPNGNAGWQGNIPTPFNFNEYLGKMDYQLNAAHRLSVSYFNTGGTSTTKGAPNVPWASRIPRGGNIVSTPRRLGHRPERSIGWLTFSDFGGRETAPRPRFDLGSLFTIRAPNLPQITVTGYFTLDNKSAAQWPALYLTRRLQLDQGQSLAQVGGDLLTGHQQTLLNNYGFRFNAGSTARVAGPGVTAAAGNAFADS